MRCYENDRKKTEDLEDHVTRLEVEKVDYFQQIQDLKEKIEIQNVEVVFERNRVQNLGMTNNYLNFLLIIY